MGGVRTGEPGGAANRWLARAAHFETVVVRGLHEWVLRRLSQRRGCACLDGSPLHSGNGHSERRPWEQVTRVVMAATTHSRVFCERSSKLLGRWTGTSDARTRP